MTATQAIIGFGPLISTIALVLIYCMPRPPVIRPDGSVYQPKYAHIYSRRFAIRGAGLGILFGVIAAFLTWAIR